MKKSFFALVAMVVALIATPVTANAQDAFVASNQAEMSELSEKAQSKAIEVYAGDKTEIYYGNAYYKYEVTSWKSSNTKVATVTKKNSKAAILKGIKPGKAIITAKLKNGTVAKGEVEVFSVMKPSEKSASVASGSTKTMTITLYKGKTLNAKMANKNVATFKWGKKSGKDRAIKITGKKVGKTTLTIGNNFNKEKLAIKVTVKKKTATSNPGTGNDGAGSVRRALVIGQEYKGLSNALPACKSDAKAMDLMLKKTGYSSVKTIYDADADTIENSISSAFKGADSDDVSLVYYSGHGASDGSLCAFTGYSITGISPSTFAGWLDEIPGKVIVIIDCCYSGAYVNKSNGNTYSDLLIKEFEKMEYDKAGELCKSKYQVLTAANKSEYSWCNAYYGLFTKALVDGVGYNYYYGDKLSSAPADSDSNNKLSLHECWKYVYAQTSYKQHAQCYPVNSSYTLFTR